MNLTKRPFTVRTKVASVIAAAENVYLILKGLSTSGDVMIAGRYPGGNLRASVGYDCSAIRPAHLVATLDCF